jgi:hypothetical protein
MRMWAEPHCPTISPTIRSDPTVSSMDEDDRRRAEAIEEFMTERVDGLLGPYPIELVGLASQLLNTDMPIEKFLEVMKEKTAEPRDFQNACGEEP